MKNVTRHVMKGSWVCNRSYEYYDAKVTQISFVQIKVREKEESVYFSTNPMLSISLATSSRSLKHYVSTLIVRTRNAQSTFISPSNIHMSNTGLVPGRTGGYTARWCQRAL